jgi:Ni/Fe-hydrogenase subunit HybB-like protein
MTGHLTHVAVPGPLLTRAYKMLLAVVALGAASAFYRFAAGIGAVSNLNDGYPWGIWIAIDVVVGTAIGCGGYAVALLVYVMNQGRYHPLVRPAVLTSLLGYGLAVLAVAIDLGRPWGLWKVPVMFWRWTGSPQLEVALCVATYVLVLVLELSPAALEKWRMERLAGVVDRFMPWLLALGLLLPTMHQSSLGTMMLLPGPRVHALWSTPWLPLLFLLSCLVMGYGVVVGESLLAARAFGRRYETVLLADLGKVAMWVTAAWLSLRLVDVVLRGALPLVASGRGVVFLIETALHVAAVVLLASASRRAQPVVQLQAAMLLVLAGAMYRVDTYLVAFQPGAHFSYFPAVPEILITIGILALEVALYVLAVKKLPILAGEPSGRLATAA